MEDYQTILRIAVALAIGLLVGIERGWKGRREEEGDRIAGIRTFSLIGLLGGVWAQLAAEYGSWMIIVAFLAVTALVIVSHFIETQEADDIGTTTQYAMLLTFTLAAWASFGNILPALVATGIVVTLLGLKPPLHSWLRTIEIKELYAGIKLLVISVVLLPLLPNQGYGPWESLNLYWIWWMVVLISGISFVGYFAIKYAGNRGGTILTSITGGLASSTAVTISLADFARKNKFKGYFMAGVLLASSIMFIRVLIEVAAVNAALLHPLWIPTAVMFLAVVAGSYWLLYNYGGEETETDIEIKNPLNLSMAIKFAVLLAAIFVLATAMEEWFGDEGIYVLSVVSGLMDVDAITVSLARMAKENLSAEVATAGIVLASATNTLVKAGIFAFMVGIKASQKLISLIVLSVLLGLATLGVLMI